jgi:hypothetical protein
VAAGGQAESYAAPDRNHGTLNIRIGTADDHVTAAIERFIGVVLATPMARWQPDLTFDADQRDGRPLPVNAMNLAVFDDALYCGTAAAFEDAAYSQHRALVYRKSQSAASWQLDADGGPGSERIACLETIRLTHDAEGRALAQPWVRLVAGSMAGRRQGKTVPSVALRDTDGWHQVPLPLAAQVGFQIRSAAVHRDAVTGADCLLLAVSPPPAGIIRGVVDVECPGGIRFDATPELVDAHGRGNGKWYGITTVNGVCLAANRSGIWRRIDGVDPRWQRVFDAGEIRGERGNGEIRGLTPVPDPDGPGACLLFSHRMQLWRMQVSADPADPHRVVAECDLRTVVQEAVGGQVVFAEAAFNPLLPWTRTDGDTVWPIGVQYVMEDPHADPTLPLRQRVRLPAHAAYLLRSTDGTMQFQCIEVAPGRVLFLARDFQPSPFPDEPGALYACGYNGSYFKGSLGTAWVYRWAP